MSGSRIMNYNVELLFILIVSFVAIVTFIVSLCIRHKHQMQQAAMLKELKSQAEDAFDSKSESVFNSRPLLDSSRHSNLDPHKVNQNNELLSLTPKVSTNEKWTTTSTEVKSSSPKKYSDLIILYVMAKSPDKFQGYDLLQALLTAGFRYGEMSIFHRHEKPNGEGVKLFSLASATEPGIFDMNKMGGFSTPGLLVFMQLTGAEHDLKALNLLIQVGEQLSEDLNGELLGADRQPLTPETIESYRSWVELHLADLI
jgi:cell division protein ZipA